MATGRRMLGMVGGVVMQQGLLLGLLGLPGLLVGGCLQTVPQVRVGDGEGEGEGEGAVEGEGEGEGAVEGEGEGEGQPDPCAELDEQQCLARPDCTFVPLLCDCPSSAGGSDASPAACGCYEAGLRAGGQGICQSVLPLDCGARTQEQCAADGRCQLVEAVACDSSGQVPAAGAPAADRVACPMAYDCVAVQPLPADCGARSLDRCAEDGRCQILPGGGCPSSESGDAKRPADDASGEAGAMMPPCADTCVPTDPLPANCWERSLERCGEDGSCRIVEEQICPDSSRMSGEPAGSGDGAPAADAPPCEVVQRCAPGEPLPDDCALRSLDRCGEDGRCLVQEVDFCASESGDGGAGYAQPPDDASGPCSETVCVPIDPLPADCGSRSEARCAEDGTCQMAEVDMCASSGDREPGSELPVNPGDCMARICVPVTPPPVDCSLRSVDECAADGQCWVQWSEICWFGDSASGSGEADPAASSCEQVQVCLPVGQLPDPCAGLAEDACNADPRCQAIYPELPCNCGDNCECGAAAYAGCAPAASEPQAS